MRNRIEIFKSPDNKIELTVSLDTDTVWLSQDQLVLLFERNQSVISRHIKNIISEGELDEKSNMQKMHIPNSDKPVTFYNLDFIISIGYRVKSLRGTQFRKWATQRLKDYLVEGFTINQKRLEELNKIVTLINQPSLVENLELIEAKGIVEILTHYTRSFVILNQYDSHNVQLGQLSEEVTYEIRYHEAKEAINVLKEKLISEKEATDLFGNEKDSSFESSLLSIIQTFGGRYLYPSIEEQAAHLLYFIIKNHSFTDGNKRIGAFMFIWFLEKNKHRFKKSGEVKINDNGLVAIALLVAQSKPEEKELIIGLIISLISDHS